MNEERTKKRMPVGEIVAMVMCCISLTGCTVVFVLACAIGFTNGDDMPGWAGPVSIGSIAMFFIAARIGNAATRQTR